MTLIRCVTVMAVAPAVMYLDNVYCYVVQLLKWCLGDSRCLGVKSSMDFRTTLLPKQKLEERVRVRYVQRIS